MEIYEDLEIGGREVYWATAASPWGEVAVAWTAVGICAVMFMTGEEEIQRALDRRFRGAKIVRAEKCRKDISTLHLVGTPFRRAVWKALLGIPKGTTVTYAQVAAMAGNPKACRAVGAAIGANPIAIIIPCHRVLPAAGGVGSYHWGTRIKKALLRSEIENFPEE